MKKELLERYINIKNEIKLCEKKIKELKAKKDKIVRDSVITSGQFPYTPHSTQIEGVDMQSRKRRLAAIRRQEEILQQMKDQALDLECEVYEFIQSVPDTVLRQAMIYKYIDNNSWEEVGDKVFMHRTTISDKVTFYLSKKTGSSQSS